MWSTLSSALAFEVREATEEEIAQVFETPELARDDEASFGLDFDDPPLHRDFPESFPDDHRRAAVVAVAPAAAVTEAVLAPAACLPAAPDADLLVDIPLDDASPKLAAGSSTSLASWSMPKAQFGLPNNHAVQAARPSDGMLSHTNGADEVHAAIPGHPTEAGWKQGWREVQEEAPTVDIVAADDVAAAAASAAALARTQQELAAAREECAKLAAKMDLLQNELDLKRIEAGLLRSTASGPRTFPKAAQRECAELARRLGASAHTLQSTAGAVQVAGERLAFVTSRLALAEAKADELEMDRLVVKNLIVTWIERGSRRDVLGVLASKLGLDKAERQRVGLEPKPAATAMRGSFSDRLADFVRDETS
jgi:hypothetical protein